MAARNPIAQEKVASHIVITPDTAHGRPRIAGHRIRVQDVAIWHEQTRMSPEEIADQFELTLGEVHAALAYYFDHVKEIQADLERDRKIIAAAKKQSPSLVQAKLKKARG